MEENKSFGRVRLIAILKTLQRLETLLSDTLPYLITDPIDECAFKLN